MTDEGNENHKCQMICHDFFLCISISCKTKQNHQQQQQIFKDIYPKGTGIIKL